MPLEESNMSNHSEFIILVGTGHPYGGEGIIIHDTISLHTDKGGWFCQAEEHGIYWRNSRMDDAFLMISLYFIFPHMKNDGESKEKTAFCQLRQKAEDSFHVSLFEHALDTQNSKHISKQALQELYQENQNVLSLSNVKLVGLRLGARSIMSDIEDSVKEEFLETVGRYGLNNVEFCETVYGRFWGGFDNKPREYKGKVIAVQA
jgi:hypothetical protein